MARPIRLARTENNRKFENSAIEVKTMIARIAAGRAGSSHKPNPHAVSIKMTLRLYQVAICRSV